MAKTRVTKPSPPLPSLTNDQVGEVVAWLAKLVSNAEDTVASLKASGMSDQVDFVAKNMAYWSNVASGLTWAKQFLNRELKRRARAKKG